MVVTRVLDAYVLIKILRTVVHCDTTVIAIFVTNECLPWPFPTHEISVLVPDRYISLKFTFFSNRSLA
jgi:hypothetical protein